MNYQKIYNDLMSKAKRLEEERLLDKEGYYERHHILPRSMGGGDEDENLVMLTAREHFVAHLLLVRFVTKEPYASRMKFALFAMCNQRADGQEGRYTPSSRIYEFCRVEHANAMSKLHKGKTLSEEHIRRSQEGLSRYRKDKDKVSKARKKIRRTRDLRGSDAIVSEKMKELWKDPTYKESVSSGLAKHYASERGQEHRAITSKLTSERWKDPAYRDKMARHTRDFWDNLTPEEYEEICRKKSEAIGEEARRRISESVKSRAKELHAPVECEHCKKMISRQNYAQFHGSKCKVLTGVSPVQRERINCKYCGKSCTPGTINRWHNENCKYKDSVTLLD